MRKFFPRKAWRSLQPLTFHQTSSRSRFENVFRLLFSFTFWKLIFRIKYWVKRLTWLSISARNTSQKKILMKFPLVKWKLLRWKEKRAFPIHAVCFPSPGKTIKHLKKHLKKFQLRGNHNKRKRKEILSEIKLTHQFELRRLEKNAKIIARH